MSASKHDEDANVTPALCVTDSHIESLGSCAMGFVLKIDRLDTNSIFASIKRRYRSWWSPLCGVPTSGLAPDTSELAI
jgi:hypothetical protein